MMPEIKFPLLMKEKEWHRHCKLRTISPYEGKYDKPFRWIVNGKICYHNDDGVFIVGNSGTTYRVICNRIQSDPKYRAEFVRGVNEMFETFRKYKALE